MQKKKPRVLTSKLESTSIRLLHPIKRLTIHLWEKANRLDTTAGFSVTHQHPQRALLRSYQPSDWRTMKRISSVVDLSSGDVFIDFGSGKGRMVLLAARYPIKKVIGVEISEELNAIAKKNLKQYRHKLICKGIELIHGDAAEFAPPKDFTIAYFFNPFEGRIFKQVVSNIKASLEACPRRIWLIYKNPVMKPFLDGCTWLKLHEMNHNTAYYRSF